MPRLVDKIRLFLSNKGKGVAILGCFVGGALWSYKGFVSQALKEGSSLPEAFGIGAKIFVAQKLPALGKAALLTMTTSMDQLVHGANATGEVDKPEEILIFAETPVTYWLIFMMLVNNDKY